MSRLHLLAVLLIAPFLSAQSPAEEWRTIQTPHFRVHYPVEYEAWASRAAERLESIRVEVSEEIGFTPEQTIDVLVVNPIAEPNGSAWPLLDTPRMIFYTEPPGPDEQIGAYGHWIDLLAVHETAHVVHMLRPSRNPFGRLVERFLLPLNPITREAPRWVLEGYATVVEGRLTGAGRPSSTIRALILRRWAENGRLPSYQQLNSDSRFAGMSMAYLAGSAYLEWLEQRSSPDALRNLWSRMTARHRRSFEEAFAGVFGDPPERLYGQFSAELTASAVTVRRGGELREGELFQETSRASGDPAVSPDGSKIAVVLRPRNQAAKLVVWSTGEPTEEEEKYAKQLDEILAKDPMDVRPVRSKPLPRKATHSLVMPDGGDIDTPRWTRDGKALVFSHRSPDADGFLHFDLYRWDLENVTRITQLADVRDADPLPDGRSAVAVRSRYGATQLVTVDLTTGSVTPREEESIDIVVTNPRVSPDGSRLASVAHRNGRWGLYIDGEAVPFEGTPAFPEWISNDELVVTLFTRGFAELYRVDRQSVATAITRTAGGAFDASSSPDGRLFFMSLQPDGYVVRVLPPPHDPAPPLPALDPSLVPAIPPVPGPATQFTSTPVQPRPYGLGRQELSWFTSSNFAPEHQAIEVGIRAGDVVGRIDTLLIGSFGRDDAPEGVALASAYRGWPIEVSGHLFHADDEEGMEVRGRWARQSALSRITAEAGVLSDDLVFGNAGVSTRQVIGSSRFEQQLRVEVDDAHHRAIGAIGYRSGAFRVGMRYQIDRGDDVTLGGMASSVLPRSAYAHRVLDPALPAAVLSGEEYDGWRAELTFGLPMTAFYQRHELDENRLSIAGAELKTSLDANPILKVPGLDFMLGVARILDAPLKGDTKWWIGMRWRP